MSSKSKHFYEFEDFRLDAENPALWRAEKLVSISPKALQALILLVEKKGEIVSREDLLEKVWKETYVEEGNINYTISLLRKILGNKEFIQTIPRRGYRFVADVKQVSENAPLPQIELFAPVADQPKVKNRPMFFSAAVLIVFLFTLLAFAWRENSTAAPRTDPRANAEAMQAYRRGMMILDDKDVENRAQRALDEFQQAVTFDPTSALAHAGLAEGLASKAASLPNERSVDVFAKAKLAVEKAFSLEANLFEAYLVRGWIKRNGDWDWSGAEEDLHRAIELNPGSARAHYRYSQLLAVIGRHSEALAEIKKAYEIDPLSEIIQSGHFPLLESAGEYEKALKLAQEYLQSNGENPAVRRALGTFQYHLGDYPAVIENGEVVMAKSGNRKPFGWLSLLAAAYLKTGQTEKADEMLRELEIQSHTDKKALYSLAMNYAELGRTDEAISALEKCLEVREQRMMWVGAEPRFANLKNDPRFRAILGKMRLN